MTLAALRERCIMYYEHFSPDRRDPYFEPLGLPRGMALAPVTAYAEACLKQLHWPRTMATLRDALERSKR
jgi:hypothetical protein